MRKPPVCPTIGCVHGCCGSFVPKLWCGMPLWRWASWKPPPLEGTKYYWRSNWWGQWFQSRTRRWRLCSSSMRRSNRDSSDFQFLLFYSLILHTYRWSTITSPTSQSWSWRRKIWRGRCQGTCTRSHGQMLWMVKVIALHRHLGSTSWRMFSLSFINNEEWICLNQKTLQQTQLVCGPQSLQLALQFSGQVCAAITKLSELPVAFKL